MSEEGAKPVPSLSKYALFVHSVFPLPSLYLILCSTYPPYFFLALILPFILFTQAIPFRRFSVRSHPHLSVYPDSCFWESDSWTQSLFYGECFPTSDASLGIGEGEGGRGRCDGDGDWHKPSKSSLNEGGGGSKLTP